MRGVLHALSSALLAFGAFAGMASSSAAQSGGSFSDTPSGTNAVCPGQNQWLLLYWRGGATAVANTAPACPAIDRLWTNSGGRWLGYSPSVSREANDDFQVATGQALFVRGSASASVTLTGTLTAIIGDPSRPGGVPAQQVQLLDDQGQSWSVVIDDKTVLSGTIFSLNGRRVRIVGEPAAAPGSVRARSIELIP
jgi:hypothetical protein